MPYVHAAVLVVAAQAAGMLTQQWAKDVTPVRFLLVAVMLAARLFGIGPALVATALAGGMHDWFNVGPHRLLDGGFEFFLDALTFLASALVVGIGTETLRRQRIKLLRSLDERETAIGDGERRHAALLDALSDREQAHSELRQQNGALEEARARFHGIADATPAPIWTATPDGVVTFANQSLREFVGTGFGGWPGVIHPEDLLGFVQAVSALAEKPDVRLQHAFRCRRADGEWRWLLASGVAQRNGDGACCGFVGLATDVTPWKEMEAERDVLRRGKDDFMMVMSHELRTPLNAILGYSSLLLEEQLPAPLPPDDVPPVQAIHQKAQHLLALVEEILSFGTLRETSDVVRMEQVRLFDAVTECVGLLTPVAKERGLFLITDVTYAPAFLLTDASKLRRILRSLIQNAINYSRRSGHVRVTVSENAGKVEFAVADDGIGIAPADLGRIFEPYVQVQSAMTRDVGGLGLGLTTSLRLSQILGGTIMVESTPGRGSIFTLHLPT